jgi:3-dehydroquinate synthase
MLTVNLPHCSYPIYIGHSIFTHKEFWKALIPGSQVCIVTNETIAPLYLSQFIEVFSDYSCSTIILPDGEAHKKIDVFLQVIDTLVVDQHRRSTTLIALGGGVIGDVTGFVAACYQRGVGFIQVPTTLLAQVDAAIGGKVGINYRAMKNFIGTFYQPNAVIIDTVFLATLPEREFRAGLAEVIKYGLIQDKIFFDYLCQNIEAILRRSPDFLSYVIEVSCRIKICFVEQDEYDKHGRRALLNFGHTFGHALESVMNYTILHGEAVAWGMRKACQLSQRLGYLSQEEVVRVRNLLEQCNLLISTPAGVAAEALITSMRTDKKNSDDNVRLILLKSLGEAFIADTVSPQMIREVLEDGYGG